MPMVDKPVDVCSSGVGEGVFFFFCSLVVSSFLKSLNQNSANCFLQNLFGRDEGW